MTDLTRQPEKPTADAGMSEPLGEFLEDPPAGVAEAIELYEAAMRYYAPAAAAYRVPVRKVSATSVEQAAAFPS